MAADAEERLKWVEGHSAEPLGVLWCALHAWVGLVWPLGAGIAPWRMLANAILSVDEH